MLSTKVRTVNRIPTGFLFTGQYSRGLLETLSIGDYGKAQNVKADWLGYTRELTGVPNTQCMPLSEKWVVTVSTQYGCPMTCTFCDVPNLGFHGNATFQDLYDQLVAAVGMFPGQRYTERLNLHFARMGDPGYNDAVLDFAEWLWQGKRDLAARTGLVADVIHPVFTTSSPKKVKKLEGRLQRWAGIKNDVYNGQAGLQLSINSTSDEQREAMFDGKALALADVAAIARELPAPVGRKYCLNFALASDYEVDADRLVSLFNPEHFMVKITPIHNNNACRANGIATVGGYESFTPYAVPERELKAAGFDVLVFVPSLDEEDGLVTCGNLILGGGELRTEPSGPIKIAGVNLPLAKTGNENVSSLETGSLAHGSR